MSIVFACPRCNFVMKAPEDKGGIKVKCLQCDVSLEIPFLRGILVNVPPEQAAPVVFGTSKIKPGSATGTTPPPPMHTAAPKHSRADDWLKEAAALKDADNVDGAIQVLRRAYEEIKRDKALYPIDTFLRLPLYLQQAGKMKDAWQEFNTLLFKGYPNQPKDAALIAVDRSKVFEKMRLFLERDSRSEIAEVYGVFGLVCKGISLHKEGRKQELKAWFTKNTCSEYVDGLRKCTGNLGAVQGIKEAIVDELKHYPDVDFDKLGARMDAALRQ
jgi:hypothetical protein